MNPRMHPEDLRANLAMEFYKIAALAPDSPNDLDSRRLTLEWSVNTADALLAELAPTAKPTECPHLERIEWWTARCAEWQARAEKAEAERDALSARLSEAIDAARFMEDQRDAARARVRELESTVEALNHLDHETEEEYREWKARAERAEGRLAAIDAAREGLPKVPVFGLAPNGWTWGEWVEKELIPYAYKMRDAAAALRVELEEVKRQNAFSLMEVERLGSQLATAPFATLDRLAQARESATLAERERIIALLSTLDADQFVAWNDGECFLIEKKLRASLEVKP